MWCLYVNSVFGMDRERYSPEGTRSSGPVLPTEGQEQEEEVDTLGINKLIVDYDYLLYKINDHVQSIQYRTDQICKRQNQLVEQDIIEGQIDFNIDQFKKLLKHCDELETHFDMMDQIDLIAKSFKDRLQNITMEYSNIKRSSSSSSSK